LFRCHYFHVLASIATTLTQQRQNRKRRKPFAVYQRGGQSIKRKPTSNVPAGNLTNCVEASALTKPPHTEAVRSLVSTLAPAVRLQAILWH
jgi:hypothetical protein